MDVDPAANILAGALMAVAPVQAFIDVVGEDVAARNLANLARRGDDPRPALKQMVEEIRVREVSWWSSHGGGSWPRLAESTLARKQALGQPSDPLVATGALRDSYTVKRGKQSRRTATKNTLRYGSRVWYARFALGTKRGEPARPPMFPVDYQVRRRMVKDVTDYLMGRSKGLTW